MKFKITLLFLAFNLFAYAQEGSRATIQITGTSEMYVMPDVGVLSMQITSKKLEFNETIVALEEKTSQVKKQLMKLDFSKKDLKTKSFQIRKNTIYDRNKRRDSGYVASQNIIVEFKNSENRISEILTAFAEESVDMQMSFSFKLSDDLKTTTKEQLMTQAAHDAKRKGSLLAQSLGKEMDDIVTISYGTAPTSTISPMYRSAEMTLNDSNVSQKISGFTPEKLKISDRVYVIWNLK